MDEKNNEYIFAYEGALDRFHRIIRWLIIVIILLVLCLVGSNLAWVIYENQFETETIRVEQEAEEGNNNYIGEDGFIVNQ